MLRNGARATMRSSAAMMCCAASSAAPRSTQAPSAIRSGGGRSLPCSAANSAAVARERSERIVKDDAECEARSGMQPADAVAHSDPISAARAGDGPLVDGKDDGVALLQVHDFGARLHSRPLLG